MFDESEKDVTLAFSPEKQKAVLGHAILDDKFFKFVKDRIKANWFTDPRVSQLWTLMTELGAKYSRRPTEHEMKESSLFRRSDKSDAAALAKTLFDACHNSTVMFGSDMLGSELTDWLRSMLFMDAMKKAEMTFNMARTDRNKYDSTYTTVREAITKIYEVQFEQADVQDMGDLVKDVEQQKMNLVGALTFGHKMMDEILLPEAHGEGSLLKGDMTILLAPTNVGKTTTMVTVAAANIRRGKHVLLITHEGRTSDIRMKIWQAMLDRTRQDIIDNIGNPAFKEEFDMARQYVADYLEFIPMNRGGTTVEEVEAVVRRRQELLKGRTGKGFDLIVDDYAAKLTTAQANGGQFALRQIQEVVYNRFTAMALEHDAHVLTAIQTNREGSKINRRVKTDETRLLGMEDVMESWGPMTTATNVISINRDPVAQAKGVVTFHFCKSRSSQTGWAVTCDSKYSHGQSHTELSRAVKHGNGQQMSDKIEGMLDNYNGKEVPLNEVTSGGSKLN